LEERLGVLNTTEDSSIWKHVRKVFLEREL
jgi:hypothetical protein